MIIDHTQKTAGNKLIENKGLRIIIRLHILLIKKRIHNVGSALFLYWASTAVPR